MLRSFGTGVPIWTVQEVGMLYAWANGRGPWATFADHPWALILLVLYHLQVTGTGAVVGHFGFDKIEVGNQAAFGSHAYAHYLHHKYFEVNYSDSLVPFDRWFGTWHDGRKNGEALMAARYQRKKARASAGR